MYNIIVVKILIYRWVIMKKNLIILCLCVAFCLSLSACFGATDEQSSDGEITTGLSEESGDQPTTPEDTDPADQTGSGEELTVEPEESTDEPEETTGEPEESTDEPEESTDEPEETEKNYELPGLPL